MKTIILNIAPKLAKPAVINTCVKTVYKLALENGARIIQNQQQSDTKHDPFCMYMHLMSSLLKAEKGTVFICEHDVLYPHDWLNHTPKEDHLSYHEHGYLYQIGSGFARRKASPLSTLCGDRDLLFDGFKKNLEQYYKIGKIMAVEPKMFPIERRMGYPYIDIRHGLNATGNRIMDYKKEPPNYWKGFNFNVFGNNPSQR